MPTMEFLVEKENRQLKTIVRRNRLRVERILLEELGRKIWFLNQLDEMRLMTLAVWEEKYQVDMGYILQVLVGFYADRFKRGKKAQKQKYGFGTRLSTLTGKNAEVILQERIAKDYPDQEHIDLARYEKRKALIDDRRQARARAEGDDELEPRKKLLGDFQSPAKYVRYYRRRVTEARRELEREMQRKENRQWPWRGNPW